MTISLRNTTIAAPEIDYLEIVDSTTTLEASAYTIGPLTGPLTINEHTLGDRASLRIYDVLGITNTHHVTLDFGEVGSTVTYIDQDGISQTVAMPIIINDGKADFELVRSGTNWILNQDSEGPSTTALEALVQANDNRYQQHLIDLHSVNLNVRAVDTLIAREALAPWDNTAPGFPITSAFFKITDAPDSTTALTEIRLTPDVPKTLYIIGPAINATTGASVGGQISGYEFVATLSNDVVSYTVGAAGGAIAGGYTDPETDYVGVAYDDLTAFSTSVFDAALIAETFAEPEFTVVPDSQLLFGTEDADALLSEMAVGQAFHFHASGDVTLTSAQNIGKVTDGIANSEPSPLTVPNGAQGYIKKNATGGLLVSYITAEEVESVIDLYEQLSSWTYTATNTGQPVTPLRSKVQHGKNAVVVSDSSGGGWHFLANTENLPLTASQKVFIEFAKIPADVTDPLNPVLPPSVGIRMGLTGLVRDVVINPDTGEVVRTDTDIKVLSVVDTGNFFQVLIEYQPNAAYEYFHLYPAYGDNGAAGSNGSFQSELCVSRLELNYFGDAPAVEVDNRVLIMRQDVNTAAGLFTTAELTTDVNAGSADPNSEIKYRDLGLITEDFKDVNGAITYELHYEEVSNNGGDDVIVRFSQTSDLTETGATQLEVISNSVTTTQFVGLSLGDGTNSSLDGFNSTGFWWSIGIATLHAGAIPINQAGNIYGNIASLYIVPLTEEQKAIKAAAAYVDKPVSVVYEVEASAENSGGQPAGNGLFVIQNQVENIPFDHASFDATTSAWTFTAPLNYDLTISTQDYETRGVTGDAVRVYHFRDVTTAVGDVLGTAGEFGQNSAHTPASFVLPAGQTITVDIRSVSSGNNQILNERAKVIATVAASKEQLHAKPIDYYGYQPTALEINEYINNMVPYHAVLAHEAAGGNSKTVNVNGVAATFGNLQNATDNGSGVISFSGGTNGNFNRRGATVETITKVDEYIEVITAATGQFDTQMITLSPDATVLAESHTEVADVNTEVLRLRLAGSGFTLFDGAGTTLASGGTENGTYRFTRTYFGWKVERNGVVIHESAEVCVNYNDGSTSSAAAFAVDGVMVDAAPPWVDGVSIANNVTQAVSTGVDLTEVDEVRVTFGRTNDTWGKITVPFNPADIDLDIAAGKLMPHFGNTYLAIDSMSAADLVAGNIPFKAVTASSAFGFEVSKVEFKKRAVVEDGRELLYNDATPSNTIVEFDNGVTWQDVKDRYESISYNLVINNVAYKGSVDTADIAENRLIGIPLNSGNHFAISNISLSSGEGLFQTVSNLTDASSLQVWGVLPHGRVSNPAGTNPSDSIPAFGNGLKTSFYDLDGRNVTVLTDTAGTTETVNRPYNNAAYPFVEIEYVKDATATHGLIVRPNGTGGVQSQVRMSLVDDSNFLLSSGAGAVDATIVSIVETETTIKYMLDFSASTAAFTELEISPAGTDAALAPVPAQTGSTGIVAVNLYESIPSYINDKSASGYADVGNVRWQWGVVDQNNSADGGTVVLPAPFANTAYVVNLNLSEGTSGITGPAADVGVNMWTESLTTTQFDHNRDNDIDFAHIHWMAIGIKP